MEPEFDFREELPVAAAAASGWDASPQAFPTGQGRRVSSGWRRRHWRNLPGDMDQGLVTGILVGLIVGCLIGYFSFYELGFEAGLEEAKTRGRAMQTYTITE